MNDSDKKKLDKEPEKKTFKQKMTDKMEKSPIRKSIINKKDDIKKKYRALKLEIKQKSAKKRSVYLFSSIGFASANLLYIYYMRTKFLWIFFPLSAYGSYMLSKELKKYL